MANEESRVGVISCADHAEWFAETLAGRLAGVDGVGGSIEEQLDYYQRAMNRIVVIDDDVVYGNKQAEDIIVNWAKTHGSPRVRLIIFCDNDRDPEDPFFYRLVSDADVHDILLAAQTGEPKDALLALIEEPMTQLQYGHWKTTDTSIWEEKKKGGFLPFGRKKKKPAKKAKNSKKDKKLKKAQTADEAFDADIDSADNDSSTATEAMNQSTETVKEDVAAVEANDPAEPGSLYDVGSDDGDTSEANASAGSEIADIKPKKPVIDYSGLGDLDQKGEIDEGNLSSCSTTVAMPKVEADPLAQLNAELANATTAKAAVTAPSASGPVPVVAAPAGQVVLSLDEYNQLLLASRKPVVENVAATTPSSIEETVVAGAFEVDHDDYVAKVKENEKKLEAEFGENAQNPSSVEEQDAPAIDSIDDGDSGSNAAENDVKVTTPIDASAEEESEESNETVPVQDAADPATKPGSEGDSTEEPASESPNTAASVDGENRDKQPSANVGLETVREQKTEENEPPATADNGDDAAKPAVVESEDSALAVNAPTDPKLNEIVTAAIEGAKVNNDGTVSLKLPQGDYGAFVSALRDRHGNALGVVSPVAKKTLAVAAVAHGLGATHTALALASELARRKVKVCAVMANEEDFGALAGASDDFKPVNGCGVRWRGCDIYGWTNQHAFADDYDVAVVDCGVLDFEDENPSSPANFFLNADEKLMLLGGTPWNMLKLAELMNALGTEALQGWSFGGAWLIRERALELKNLLANLLGNESIELWEVPSRPWLFDNEQFGNSAERYGTILKLAAPDEFENVTPSENYAPKKGRSNRNRGKKKQGQNDKPKHQE